MLFRKRWKITLSAALVLWAVFTLIPLRDQELGFYVKNHVSAKTEVFSKLMAQVDERIQKGQAPSVYVALKQIGHEQKLDLSQFFPDIRFEATLHNVDKRNQILLDELLRRSKGRLQLGLDLKGGVAFTLEVDPHVANKGDQRVRKEKLDKAMEIIGARVNYLGVAEPIIRAIGENRIEVQMPGVSTNDNPEVVNSLKKPARLDFRIVNPIVAPPLPAPAGYEAMNIHYEGRQGQDYAEDLYVKCVPEMTGEGVSEAYPVVDEFSRYKIILKFKKEGRARFAQVTKEVAKESQYSGARGRLAIVLDGKLYSAPGIEKEIDSDTAEISGSFSRREAIDLANVLNNPLDLPLQVKQQYEVGPSLAADAVSSGVRASIIGATAVAAFMVMFYTIGGFVAIASLAVNILIILGVMASLGATMTLPGLAGIVLTIGMAVDANILIFERMREELAKDKTITTASQSGFLKALPTILDAHLVQLIICAIMIWLGTGPIKGFGVTLAIGVLSTLFSVLITGHLFMELLVHSGAVKKIKMFRMINDLHVDFIKYGKACFIASWLVLFLGVGVILYKGDRVYGVDFSGGDLVQVNFSQKLNLTKIREVASRAGIGEVILNYVSQLGSDKEQLSMETPYGQSDTLFNALVTTYPNAGLEKAATSQIGPSIGKEIELNALLAVGVSMATILIYIAFRFELGFGIGAMFSSLHDILMTIGIFVLFGHQFSAPMVAAILCIAGYSINETVVVFDRIREELKLNPTGSLRDVVNSAIRKVFARTIMTATTTLLATLSLLAFGGGVLRDISFTFLVGIITSTFSAIFIASQVFYWWHKGDRKHVEAHQGVGLKYQLAASSRSSQ